MITGYSGLILSLLAVLICTLTAAAEEGGSSYSKRTIINSSSTTSGAGGGSSSTTGSGENTSSGSSSSTSSTEVVEQSGMAGFRHSNKFVPKYKERIQTYRMQIEMGISKGWLSHEDSEKFSKELGRLAALEATVAEKNYSNKADIDDLDKQFTKFNMEFTNAAQKKPAPATTAAPVVTPTATKPAPTSKTPAKPAPKPAAKPAKPAAKK
ncbi:MAG: hypothetical protein K2W95_19170 [Candidatus Obscuribacterales bacterium]|nr:hypothetical protein [Candidatus Obscuribacterales bacterium]